MSKNKFHLTWITPGFAESEDDSRCIPPLQALARRIGASTNVELSIISLHHPKKRQAYYWHGIPIYPCGHQLRLKQLFNIWQHTKRVSHTDFVHSFWLNDAARIGKWLARRHQVPHWTTLMGQDARTNNRYLKWLRLKDYETIALSDFHARVFEQSTGERVKQLIPWGIEQTSVSPAEKREIDIIGIGNLISLKCYKEWVQVVAQLVKIKPDVRAVLVGDGPERTKLTQLAQQLNIEQHITFAGYVPRDEVWQLLARSRVLLHPSNYESFGMVTIEARAMGVAVVSKAVGIAPIGKHWSTAETINDMTLAVKKHWQAPVIAERILRMEDTADRYLELYGV